MMKIDEASFYDRRVEHILSRAGPSAPLDGVEDEGTWHSLVAQIWASRAQGGEVEQIDLGSADALGSAAYLAGEDPGALVRRVLRLGRALVDVGLTDGVLLEAGAQHLGEVTDQAAARVAAAYMRAGESRRDEWLSYLCHDLKNPLNTILNALWLIREHRGAGSSERFLELAERAVRRIEVGLKDVRDLHQKERTPPRGRGDTHLQPPATSGR